MAIVTISRGSMSGGEALARCLGASLGYPVLAREVLVEAAEKLGVSEELLREKIQTPSGPIERLREDRHLYLLALQSALVDHCTSGNLIYHGFAGQFLLKDLPAVLRVRLIAPMAARVQAVVEREGVDPKTALEYIKYIDQERIEWTKIVHGADWRDPRNYDVVINLRTIDLDTACVMLSSVVNLPRYAITEQVKKTFEDFALACRIQVALAVEPSLRGIVCEAHADEGNIAVTWQPASTGVETRPPKVIEVQIQKTAMTVGGIKSVTLRFRENRTSGRAA